MDRITKEQQKSIWIEKTPNHVRYIHYISKSIQGVKFVHIIRNGTDVVASLYEVTHKHPQIWGGKKTVDDCINQWLENVQFSLRYLNSSNHILVKYEQLVDNPFLSTNQVCNFLNVPFEEAMLEKYKQTFSDIILKNEPWKNGISESIKSKNGLKFNQLFNQEEKQYIIDKVSQINLDFFEKR